MNITGDLPYWTAVAEVRPEPGNYLLGNAKAAYVAVAGIANSEDEFFSNTQSAFSSMDFIMAELNDIEKIQSIHQVCTADPTFAKKLLELSINNPIELGSFHIFRDTDD